jgi:hypothetical protein
MVRPANRVLRADNVQACLGALTRGAQGLGLTSEVPAGPSLVTCPTAPDAARPARSTPRVHPRSRRTGGDHRRRNRMCDGLFDGPDAGRYRPHCFTPLSDWDSTGYETASTSSTGDWIIQVTNAINCPRVPSSDLKAASWIQSPARFFSPWPQDVAPTRRVGPGGSERSASRSRPPSSPHWWAHGLPDRWQ